jgi:hypothetical protein
LENEEGDKTPINENEIHGLPSGRPHFLVFFFWNHDVPGDSLPEQNRAVVFDVCRNWIPSFSTNHSGPDKIHPTVMQKLKEILFQRNQNCALVYQECYKKTDGVGQDSEKVVFRAINNYRSEGPWYDWCWIDWQYEGGTFPTFTTKQKTHNKQILSDNGCKVTVGSDSTLKYEYKAYSVPARLLCIFKSFQGNNELPDEFRGEEFLILDRDTENISSIRQWAAVLLEQEKHSMRNGCVPSAEVIVHSAESSYQSKHAIGHEYKMYTSQSSTHHNHTTPSFSLVDLDMIGVHTYCFEFKGCLNERYHPGQHPRIIQVHSWDDDLATQFTSKYFGRTYQ